MSTNKRFWQNWLQNFASKYYYIIANLTEMWHKVRENHGNYFDNLIMLQISVNKKKYQDMPWNLTLILSIKKLVLLKNITF